LSEVAAGSREENASKQNLEPGSDSIRTDQALDVIEQRHEAEIHVQLLVTME
jgi:hypothetical protein